MAPAYSASCYTTQSTDVTWHLISLIDHKNVITQKVRFQTESSIAQSLVLR